MNSPRYGVKYRAYTEEDMRKAAQAIMEEGMSLRKASVMFNVPKTTLAERMGDRRSRLLPPRKNAGGGGGGGGGGEDKRPTTTRYTWTEAEMEQAVEAVQAGEKVREAARRFGVPASNLNSRTRGREPKDLKGEVSRLTLKQESLLADWASAQGALGFPPTKDDVFDLAERVLRRSGGGGSSNSNRDSNSNSSSSSSTSDNKKLGKQWIGHWMRRWPNVEVLDWRSKQQGVERKAAPPGSFDTSRFAVIDGGDEQRPRRAAVG